jgi:DNA-directed RNA polymerase beta' subunit
MDLTNHGKRWTEQDQELLIEKVKENVAFNEIAQILKRNTSAVKTKMMEILYNDYKKESKSVEDIVKKYKNMDEEEIKEFIHKKENKKSRQKKNKEQINADGILSKMDEMLESINEIKKKIDELQCKN